VLHELVGPPQIAAILVLMQRGAEELHSARNTRRLLAAGAVEAGRDYYPVIVTAHLAWIAGLFLLLPATAPMSGVLLGAYLALQVVRYWVIASLGRFWTHRIITLPGAPIVRRGPYRYVAHPNYLVTIAETLLLPGAFGGWAYGLLMTSVWSAVLAYKIRLEDRALAPRKVPAGVVQRSTAAK
jgi:methyltransferase